MSLSKKEEEEEKGGEWGRVKKEEERKFKKNEKGRNILFRHISHSDKSDLPQTRELGWHYSFFSFVNENAPLAPFKINAVFLLS